MKDKYLRETRMVDFSNLAIQKLIQNMKWKEMGEFERIKAIYNLSLIHIFHVLSAMEQFQAAEEELADSSGLSHGSCLLYTSRCV